MRFIIPFFSLALSSAEIPQFTGPEALGTVASDKLKEISGVAVSQRNSNVLWVHNDGATDKVFAISTSGERLGEFSLDKNTTDLEDICIGPGPSARVKYLYVGDIGSNEGTRNKIRIFRIPEPEVNLSMADDPVTEKFANVERFELAYPNEEEYDAEALMVDPITGDVLVLTKMKSGTSIFRVKQSMLSTDATVTLEWVGDSEFGDVSAADISADGRYIAIRREDTGVIWVREPNQSVIEAMSVFPEHLPIVGPPDEANGEALSFLPDASGYITIGEGENETIYKFTKVQSPPDPTTMSFVGAPVRVGANWQIRFSGSAGTVVQLQRSADFKQWVPVANVSLTSEVATVLDEQRNLAFYRLVAAQ